MMKASPPSSQVWPNGSACEVKAKGWKKAYPGTVLSFDAATGIYTVKFSDGEVRSDVKEFHFKGPPPKQTFTAPDGTTFDNRNAYRRHLADTLYSFKDKVGETLTKSQGSIDCQSFSISNLKDCTVKLMDQSDQVLIDGVTNCRVLVGPSCESVFVRNATDCTFYIACKQFRSRDCSNCTISLYTKTEPIVETSTGMRFYPYRCAYPGQTEHFAKANLIPDNNHWCNVFDFNAGDASIPEPHWSLVPESDEGWAEWRITEGEGEPENPVPLHARAVALEREGAFGFGLTQEQAESAHQATHVQTESSETEDTDAAANEELPTPVVPPHAPAPTPPPSSSATPLPPASNNNNNNTDAVPLSPAVVQSSTTTDAPVSCCKVH
jgi:protein XRP2